MLSRVRAIAFDLDNTLWDVEPVLARAEARRLEWLERHCPRIPAQVSLADIRIALKELDGPDVEALLQVGTALPTVAVAAEAERWLGKPVLAVNAVTYWHALRQCGIEDRVYGYGRVLEEF